MYQNSNLTYWNVKDNYHWGNDSYLDERYVQDGKKSLFYKILETMNRFSMDESIPTEMMQHVMLTGGGLQLGSQSGLKLTKVIEKQLTTHLPESFPYARVKVAENPHVGSILNGAKILFGL